MTKRKKKSTKKTYRVIMKYPEQDGVFIGPLKAKSIKALRRRVRIKVQRLKP